MDFGRESLRLSFMLNRDRYNHIILINFHVLQYILKLNMLKNIYFLYFNFINIYTN